MRPESAVLLAVSNTQMIGLYGNLLPGLLTAIQSWMRCGGMSTIQSKQLKTCTVDILGREAWQLQETLRKIELWGGSIVFALPTEANVQLHC